MRPQHSLHSLFLRLCSRMPAQPRLLHWLLLRCSQMLAPPHSLHSLLFQLSSQDAYPTALLALSPCPVMLTDSHNSFTLSPFPAPLCSSGPPTVPSCSSFWPDFPNREETSHRQIDTRRRLPTRLLLLFSLDARETSPAETSPAFATGPPADHSQRRRPRARACLMPKRKPSSPEPRSPPPYEGETLRRRARWMCSFGLVGVAIGAILGAVIGWAVALSDYHVSVCARARVLVRVPIPGLSASLCLSFPCGDLTRHSSHTSATGSITWRNMGTSPRWKRPEKHLTRLRRMLVVICEIVKRAL